MEQRWPLSMEFDSDEGNADGGVDEECKRRVGKSNGKPDENGDSHEDTALLSLPTDFYANMLQADVFLAFSEGR